MLFLPRSCCIGDRARFLEDFASWCLARDVGNLYNNIEFRGSIAMNRTRGICWGVTIFWVEGVVVVWMAGLNKEGDRWRLEINGVFKKGVGIYF